MADMSVALRVFAETGEAQAGLRQLAEALRGMGVGQREAATLAATAGREAAQSWGGVAAPARASAEVIDLLGLRAREAGDQTGAAAREAENAWIASGHGITGAMTAVGAALETGVPDLSGWLGQQAAEITDTALASAEAAVAVAEFRAMLHPLAATAQAASDALEQVAIAEEMGALSAQEASVLIDRLNRSLLETTRVADAAGLPLDGLGLPARAAASDLQRLIEAQTGVSSTSPIAELLQQGQALDDLRARFSPVYAEARRLVTEIAAVEDAERQGAISAREASLALEGLETALAGVRAQAAQTGVSLEGLGLPARAAASDLQRLIEAQTGVARSSDDSIAAQLRHGQALDDLRARFNPLFAASRQYEQELREIAEAERLGAISAGEAAAARERAAAAMAPLAGGIARVGQASGAAAAYTANLGYQLNDIAVMMAAGQNPFMLMMQQGTQVTQVFQQMRASGLAIGASIRSAFLGMVSPMALITMGVIGGGAALVQWLGAGTEKALTLDEAMAELSSTLSDYERSSKDAGQSTSDLRDRFGAAATEARVLLKELAAIDARRALQAVGTAFQAAVGEEGFGLGSGAVGAGADLGPMSDLFGLDRRNPAHRDAIYGARNAMIDFNRARFDPDPDRRLDRMAEAAGVMVRRTREAIDLDGQRSDSEERLLRTLVDQSLALERQKELRADAARTAVQMAQAGEDRATRATRPEPMSGTAFQASFAERADLDRQAAMAALIAQHGRDSLLVARARVEEERRLYEVQLSAEEISATERQRRLDAWDLAKGMPALERDRRAEAERLLATLQAEEAVQQAIRTYGADSAEVARLRADQERAAMAATVATLVPAGDLRDQLMAAWENARGIAATDMASGIAAARAEARAMADEIMRALGAAQALSAQGITGLRESALRVKHAKDPVALAGALGRERMIAAQGVRRQGAEGLELAALDAEVNAYARNLEQIERNNQAQRAAIGKGGKGGGGEARDTLAGLTKEATEVLAALDLAAGGVAEKVRAGLMSVAEGETAMAQAKGRAAGQLAELIARLDRLGPAGKAAADAARGALRDLAAEAGRTDRSIRDGMVKSFEDSFVRSLATGKSAFSSFADHIQTELARAFTQKFVTPMMSPLIDGIMGMFTGLFSARGNVIAAGHLVPYALGGVPDSGLPALGTHANSVVDQPTVFAMAGNQVGVMGEAGAEAILPLLTGSAGQGVRGLAPDGSTTVLPLRRAPGGALGVQLPEAPDVGAILRRPSFFADGGVIGRLSDAPRVGEPASGSAFGTGSKAINVNIANNHPSAKVTATERPGDDGMSIDVVIDQIEAGIADRARRGIGPLAAVLGDSFGARRVGR